MAILLKGRNARNKWRQKGREGRGKYRGDKRSRVESKQGRGRQLG
jgi:hypothetical protein